MNSLISIVVPLFNEEKNIPLLYAEFCSMWRSVQDQYSYELIFINDGSRDGSQAAIERLLAEDAQVKFIEFSRNFGKEAATSAGIQHAQGDAIIMIDADLQHPVEIIPEFLRRWREGAEVVVGLRQETASEGIIKKIGSRLFYKIQRLISETEMEPNTTDFRLLDRKVADAFNALTERQRITRGLIDWLGFERAYVPFAARERAHGEASYSMLKLFNLAVISFISHSLIPLRLALYIGMFIVLASGILGIVMFLDRYVVAWELHFSGPAILADIILFLVGIVLICLGIFAFYIGSIHRETQNRPMYIVRKKSESLKVESRTFDL